MEGERTVTHEEKNQKKEPETLKTSVMRSLTEIFTSVSMKDLPDSKSYGSVLMFTSLWAQTLT